MSETKSECGVDKTENSLTLVEDNRINNLHQLKNKVTMVAHFVCLLFTAFIVYTAQPGSSKFLWKKTGCVKKMWCTIDLDLDYFSCGSD